MTRDRKYKLHDGKVGAAITVHITPHAKDNQLREILGDGTIHINLTASSETQELNQSLINFLSQVLGIKKDEIEIIGGQQGLDKLVSILNIDADTVQTRISKYPK